MGADTIRRAHAVHPVAALQIEYSLMSRGIEAEILPAVRELGISVTAYGVLSRGLLSGQRHRAGWRPGDPRAPLPPVLRARTWRGTWPSWRRCGRVAGGRRGDRAQLAIAWVASRGEDIIPLIGTKRRDRLAEALNALDLTLSADDLAAIEAAVPAGAVAGRPLRPGPDGAPSTPSANPRTGTRPSGRSGGLLQRVQVDQPDVDDPLRVAPVQVDQVDHAEDHEPGHARAHVGVAAGPAG